MFLRNFKLYSVFIIFLLFFSTSYAICLDSPTFIRVSSGSDYVGQFNMNYLNSQELIYVKNDFDENPLKVDFYFEGQENDCFSSQDDVQMRAFSSGILMSAESISTQGNQTIAKFNFEIDTIAPSSFNSNYIVKNKNNLVGTENIIKFGTDDEAPDFTSFSYSPNKILILPNTSININYGIQDTKSTLGFLRINGKTTTIINFESLNETYSSSLSENLISSRTYYFVARDKLSNEAVKNVTYVVDGNGPLFTDFNVESYTRNEFGTRKATFSVEVEDISYTVDSSLPIVKGDFTSINNADNSKDGVCVRVDGENDKYKCLFEDVDITLLNQTTTVQFNISSTDVLGNSNTQVFSKEVFYDTAGPQIKDFYLENSKGEKNIFNSLDTNAKIVVEFTDESAEDKNDIRLFPNFDGIETFLIPNCDNISNSQGSCYWNLDNTLSKYSGVEVGDISFSLTLVDVYGNPTTQILNLSINNEKPEVTNIELVETTDIKDRIVNSGEKINFRVFIKDTNLKFENKFIYGNFSTIDFRDGMEKKAASCNYYNESLIQCDFTGIIVENGYMNRNISFIISDTAGNTLVKEYEVEVFAIGNEVFSSFKIPDIIVTNALDRYVIKNAGIDAWFEGKLDLQDGNPDIKVVNYQLKSCNDSNLNPVLLGERKLYPLEVQVSEIGTIEADKNFIVKVEVKTHPNYDDLETSKMKCTMAVLKRDNEQIYPAELVDFNLQFEYFNLPYDDLMSANADKILGMIDEAEGIGAWFDTIYDIYKIFDTVCGVVNSGDGIISGVGQAWYSVSMLMHSNPYTEAAAQSGDKTIFGVQGTISKLRHGLGGLFEEGSEAVEEGAEAAEEEGVFSYVKNVCDWVTCSNGKGGIFYDENGFGADASSIWKSQFPEGYDFAKGSNTLFGLTDFSNQCSDEEIMPIGYSWSKFGGIGSEGVKEGETYGVE